MNKLKQFILLFMGIFIGYVMANFLPNDLSEKIQLSEPFSEVTRQVTSENQTTKNTLQIHEETNIQSSQPAIKYPESIENTNTSLSNTSNQELEDKYQQLSEDHQVAKNKVSALQRQLDELDPSDITSNQMEDLVAAPFKDQVASYTGSMRDQIYNFHQAEDDLDWGYTMQNYISDFILTHYNSSEINLVSVVCKLQNCELLVIENVEGSWGKLTTELTVQPWWKFTSFSSSSRNVAGSENSLAIYNFLSV
jgi:uncharacterized membrane-anchored protein YhcB (DUF1043 family)